MDLERILNERKLVMDQREEAMDQRGAALDQRGEAMDQQEAALEKWEASLEKWEAAMREMKNVLDRRAEKIAEARAELDLWGQRQLEAIEAVFEARRTEQSEP
jgi:hypothetical protein